MQTQNILLAILCSSSMVILLLGVMTRFVMAAQQGRLMWCVLHCSETPADSTLNAAAACQASPLFANSSNPVLPLWQLRSSANCVSLHEAASHSVPHNTWVLCTEPRAAQALPNGCLCPRWPWHASSPSSHHRQTVGPANRQLAADKQHLAQPPSWTLLSMACA